MIELLIAFLISLGWNINADQTNISVHQDDNNRFGIVLTDDAEPKFFNATYDGVTKTFHLN